MAGKVTSQETLVGKQEPFSCCRVSRTVTGGVSSHLPAGGALNCGLTHLYVNEMQIHPHEVSQPASSCT